MSKLITEESVKQKGSTPILEGIFSSICECGKCNVPSYPYRIYDRTWSCKEKKWIKQD